MQAKGTLDEVNLKRLLEDAQSERATGTLTVRNDGSAYTLYFLFGHLFHATGEDKAGDDAVLGALGWSSGEFDFDAKAKLPADETVKSSIGELLAAEPKAGAQASEQPAEAAEEPASQAQPAAPEASWEPQQATPAPEPEPEPAAEESRAAAEESRPAAEESKSEAKEIKPAAEEAKPAAEQKSESGPEPEPARKGVKHRPSPKHGREPVPVPAGQVIYDSLKTSFVDFPRLITTLEREAYTGYVRLLTDDAAGLILFKDGAALECVYDIGDDPTPALGRNALSQFNAAVTHGQGVLDVVGLSPELVDGLFELTVAKPLYADLYASWVDPKKLLAFLEKRKLSGSLMVRAEAGTGVIILTAGKLTGAYTSDSRDIAETADGPLELCRDDSAVIEVKAADDSKREPLDVDSVVGARGAAAAPKAAEQAPAAAPAPAEPPPLPQPPAAAEPTTQQVQTQPAGWLPSQPEQATQSLPSLQAEPPTPPAQPTASLPAVPADLSPAPAPAGDNVDWDAVIADLQSLTEEALGNRARKVKDVLGAADRSRGGLEAAIDQVPTISILFVDSSRLEALAADLRAKLQAHLA